VLYISLSDLFHFFDLTTPSRADVNVLREKLAKTIEERWITSTRKLGQQASKGAKEGGKQKGFRKRVCERGRRVFEEVWEDWKEGRGSRMRSMRDSSSGKGSDERSDGGETERREANRENGQYIETRMVEGKEKTHPPTFSFFQLWAVLLPDALEALAEADPELDGVRRLRRCGGPEVSRRRKRGEQGQEEKKETHVASELPPLVEAAPLPEAPLLAEAVADPEAPLEPDLPPPPLDAAEEAESVAEAAPADAPPPDASPAEPPPEVLPSLVLRSQEGQRVSEKGKKRRTSRFRFLRGRGLESWSSRRQSCPENKERVSTVQLGEAEMSTHTNGKSDVLPSFDVGNPPHTPRFFDRRKRLKRRSASGTARKNCATGNRKSILVVKGRKEEDEPVMV
jgi:hypothetical protein